MKIESIAENSLLYDFYGQLLSRRQQEVMALYHEENLSLSEISDEFGISRQAVHDTLKKAEQALGEYEAKLGLVARMMRSKKAIADIDERIDSLISELTKCGGSAGAGEPGALAKNCRPGDCQVENCRPGDCREENCRVGDCQAGDCRRGNFQQKNGQPENFQDESAQIAAKLEEIKTIINDLE